MKTSLRGDFTVNKVQPLKQFDYLSFFTRKGAKTIEGRVDLGLIELRNDPRIKFTNEKVQVDS